MRRALIGLLLVITTLIIVFFAMGFYSKTGSPPGLSEGQLAACPDKPNCVSSESSPSDEHAIPAIRFTPC